MINKLTLLEYNEIKYRGLCVVSFKDGIRTFTYGSLSYKQAVDYVVKKQAQGEICLTFPFPNIQTSGIKGFETRSYNPNEETLEYYQRVFQESFGEEG